MTYSSLEEIAEANIPVLLPDTCIILDILRSPRRENVDGNSILAGRAIRAAIHASGEIGCIIAGQVRSEFTDNLSVVREDTAKTLKKLSDEIRRIDGWSIALGHESETDVSHFLSRFPIAESIVNDILSSSLDFATTAEVTSRAFGRVGKNITPSAKGKDSMKDCVVVESYLEVARQLRRFGHCADIVFASSNTKEFVSGPQKVLNQDIASEFEKLGIVYTRAVHETRHRLGLSSS